jgi:hypothetical protein
MCCDRISLNRALEELEKTKTMLRGAKEGSRDVSDVQRRETESLQADKKVRAVPVRISSGVSLSV